jgi:hypothetical protein
MGESQNIRDAVGRLTERMRQSGIPADKAANNAREAMIRAERVQNGEKPPSGKYDISQKRKD